VLPLFTATIWILALLDSAHAHFVWLERDDDGPVRVYFGEWIDDIREKNGGLLDRFEMPRVFLGMSDEPLPVKPNENNFGVRRERPRRRALRGSQRSAARR